MKEKSESRKSKNTGYCKPCVCSSRFLLGWFWISTCWLLSFGSVAAQEAASSTTQPIAKVGISAQDTLPLFFSNVLSPEKVSPADDSLPGYLFRMFDPARRPLTDWGTLGNIGSSARPLIFNTAIRRGFDLGVRPFSLYQFQPEDLRFYRHARTYSEASFNRGAEQRDAMSGVALSHTFSDGLNVSVDYRTINNLGSYRHQQTKHSTIGIGMWYASSSRYEFFLIYTGNVFRQKDNGGIRTDNDFATILPQEGEVGLEIILDDEEAKSRQNLQTIQYTHFLNFGKPEKRVFRASHTLKAGRDRWKFYDPKNPLADQTNDSTFYGVFLNDRRGIRHYVAVQRLENTFFLNTFKAKKTGNPSDGFSVGLRHGLFNVQQEGTNDTLISNLFLAGNLSLTPSDRFQFVVNGDLGLLGNGLEYQVNGQLNLGLGKAGALQIGLISQRRPPDFLQHSLWLNQQPIWNLNFVKPVETTLSASYALPLIGFSATAKSHLINNYIYYNQTGEPAQASQAVNITQLILTENFKFGPVRFDNTLAFQQSNRTDLIHLPTWYSKNSFYISTKIFKRRMYTNFGADFRMNSRFTPDAYMPVTGQFFLQDSQSQQPYPQLDLFLTVKIKTFRFFFRFENATTFVINKTDLNYLTANQPQNFRGIRLGLNWRFMDSNVPTPGGNGPSTAPSGVGGGSGPGGFGGGGRPF